MCRVGCCCTTIKNDYKRCCRESTHKQFERSPAVDSTIYPSVHRMNVTVDTSYTTLSTVQMRIIFRAQTDDIMKDPQVGILTVLHLILSDLQTHSYPSLRHTCLVDSNERLYDDTHIIYTQEICADCSFHLGIAFDSSSLPQLIWNTIQTDVTNEYEPMMSVWKRGCLKNERIQRTTRILDYIRTYVVPDEVADTDDVDTCTICLEPLSENTTLCKLPKCSHVFHKDCISKWMRISRFKDCPYCKTTQD